MMAKTFTNYLVWIVVEEGILLRFFSTDTFRMVCKCKVCRKIALEIR